MTQCKPISPKQKGKHRAVQPIQPSPKPKDGTGRRTQPLAPLAPRASVGTSEVPSLQAGPTSMQGRIASSGDEIVTDSSSASQVSKLPPKTSLPEAPQAKTTAMAQVMPEGSHQPQQTVQQQAPYSAMPQPLASNSVTPEQTGVSVSQAAAPEPTLRTTTTTAPTSLTPNNPKKIARNPTSARKSTSHTTPLLLSAYKSAAPIQSAVEDTALIPFEPHQITSLPTPVSSTAVSSLEPQTTSSSRHAECMSSRSSSISRSADLPVAPDSGSPGTMTSQNRKRASEPLHKFAFPVKEIENAVRVLKQAVLNDLARSTRVREPVSCDGTFANIGLESLGSSRRDLNSRSLAICQGQAALGRCLGQGNYIACC